MSRRRDIDAFDRRENPGRVSEAARRAYERFHGVPPSRVDSSRVEVPLHLVLVGRGIDIGYGVQDRQSEKEGWYVHDFGPNVKVYAVADLEPAGPCNTRGAGLTLRAFPSELLVLGGALGLTYEGDDGRKHELKGSSRKKLCATLPDRRKLVVVGPRGVELVAWGGGMRVENWIYD